MAYSQIRLDINAMSSYLNESLPEKSAVSFTQVHAGVGADLSQLIEITHFVNVGYKFGYAFYGKLNIEDTDDVGTQFDDKLTTQAVHLMAIVHYRLYKNIRLEFGGGVAYEWNSFTLDKPIIIAGQKLNFPTTAGTYSSFRPIAEVGFYYRFKKGLSAGLSYRHIFGDQVGGAGFTGDSVGVNSLAATLRYRF
ncbi:hypothetical protein BGC07_09475 [Piscirickettsia litoralis]|uniref:Outer membrane protein beta-barrel domain-containing protein n=2 Tax=Piscirickettsia litoralis TaxID=1891921 RepID=A0ABX3A386_9GAMM|nr:hypothetical protein BGC07_09475 [Piscirickettsia litoralis]